MPTLQTITPCLWFDDNAEAAVDFYLSVFANARITAVTRYGEAGQEIHRRPPGSVLTIGFELDGQSFTALNAGPGHPFSPAISLQVNCDTQDEVDHYWARLSEGGDEADQRCGWLKDRFGLSWQIVPTAVMRMLQGDDAEKAGRMMMALMQMTKLDIRALEDAYNG